MVVLELLTLGSYGAAGFLVRTSAKNSVARSLLMQGMTVNGYKISTYSNPEVVFYNDGGNTGRDYWLFEKTQYELYKPSKPAKCEIVKIHRGEYHCLEKDTLRLYNDNKHLLAKCAFDDHADDALVIWIYVAIGMTIMTLIYRLG